MPCPVVIIEGLIASGKSSLTQDLHQQLPGSEAMLEPDESSGNPYLADFYTDKTRWGFVMQIHLLALRFRMQQKAQLP